MNMTEALEWAADYAERNKIFEPPVNRAGYVRDGWMVPSPSDRADVIKDLAYVAVDDQGSKAHLEFLRKVLTQLARLDPALSAGSMENRLTKIQDEITQYLEGK